ncbi:fungal-specific transcription factor domain-containing protein [Lentinula aciculospora]|uniref:Fungal-specific transcription factor domain-containing protein n=1 Tax=Lentinula aciculospora TaxID=153920 RepID=A0A9W9AGN3_9AGAR|nr:fungal-specific transcription factor domain-containing protein [Lentinula aciculospora]
MSKVRSTCDHRNPSLNYKRFYRLKIKCDRQVPCTSCQRRGCAALCPNGSLATGQGTRFVLAATEHLHRRISRLSGRIRELEDALANIHSKFAPDGDQPHPLLENDWLLEVEEGGDDDELEPGSNRGTRDVIDALGTLSISNHGISRFFGPTGGSESLLIRETSSLSPPSSHKSQTTNASSQPSVNSVFPSGTTMSTGSPSTLDPRITLFSHRFPFTPLALPPAQIQELIESYLPTYERARELVNIYFEQVAWIFRGVSREQLDGEMAEEVIGMPSLMGPPPPAGVDYSGPHDLALLFMVFGLGAVVEPFPNNGASSDSSDGSSPNSKSSPGVASRPSPNTLGEHYHQLAQAALSLQPVLEKPSIVTIQCLHVMSIYNAMSGEGTANPSSFTGQSETSMEMTWSLITMAAHLNRDSERWGLSPKMVQRRRILFWDLFVADVWQSLNTGRPPSFSLAYIDCSFPQYEGVNMKDGNSQGRSDPSTSSEGSAGIEKSKRDGYAYEIWQFRFASECLAEVVSRTLTAEAPSYTTIMELDRKVREFPLPDGFVDRGAGSNSDMSLSFMNCVLDHIRETILMYIHRSFFAQAIIDQPTNPLKSVYAPSFLAAYRAAATILKSVREQFIRWPNSCSRFWTMWTFAFTAAVVFGTVVTRGPRSPLAASAMTELDQAWILFSKAATYSKRATKALPILTTLREKARHALAAAQSKSPEKPLSDGELWNIKKEEIDPNDELSIFAGHTRLVSAANNTGPSGFDLTPVSSIDGPSSGLRQHRSSSQLRRHFLTDVDMEPPSRYDTMYDRRPSQSYQQHHPAPSSRPLHHRASFSSSYQENIRGSHPSLVDGWYGQNALFLLLQYLLLPMNARLTNQCSSIIHMTVAAEVGHHLLQPLAHIRGHLTHHIPPDIRNAALADLGLASRDSRLDERWSSFMQDSGLLDEVNFGRGTR